MGLLDALKSALTGYDRLPQDPDPAMRARADDLLRRFIDEGPTGGQGGHANLLLSRRSGRAPADSEAGRAILDAEPRLQVAIIRAALDRTLKDTGRQLSVEHILGALWIGQLTDRLYRRALPYTPADVEWILVRAASSRLPADQLPAYGVNLQGLLRSIERWSRQNELPESARRALEKIRERHAGSQVDASTRKLLALIDGMLGGEVTSLIDERDDWGHHASRLLTELHPEARKSWLSILEHAATVRGSRPSNRWLDEAGRRVERLGRDQFRKLAGDWLGLLNRPSLNQSYQRDDGFDYPSSYIAEQNADLLKGLAWCCSIFNDDETARILGDAALACYRKIPNVGARSTKAGNACVHSLGAIATPAAILHLQRLDQRIKLPSARLRIEKALQEAASRVGMSREDLEEIAVPTFGLEDGRIEISAGEYRAEISLAGAGAVNQRWIRPDGRSQRSVPAPVKRDYPEAVADLKRVLRDLRAALPAQRARIEYLLRGSRDWSLADWEARYCDHPFISHFARRLIWTFSDQRRSEIGIWHAGRIVNVEGMPVSWLTPEARVRLWHPIESGADTVLAWREWLELHEVTQPFKQAHREIYILTDAERQTAIYSNRFAAHILRQHQLQALCQERGWRYQLQGAWDSFNVPFIELPQFGLRAEFWVDPLTGNTPEEQSAHGIYLYVSSDQVRFVRLDDSEPVALEDVPPLIFSEVMRDVDLFVSVCSIGTDPEWLDHGPDVARGYAGYWWDFAFGDLSATAKTRRETLERLLPRLTALDGRWTLTDRFLVIRGDLRTYKIHLGSGNVLMEPNDQYLCIVPGRSVASSSLENLFLPFEGDALLSIILSKALLLVADSSIKDPTIRSQIGAG